MDTAQQAELAATDAAQLAALVRDAQQNSPDGFSVQAIRGEYEPTGIASAQDTPVWSLRRVSVEWQGPTCVLSTPHPQ